MLGLLAQPKVQNAEAAIVTLSDRLAHSSLLEDRRAAVLGLKGFSYEYRELVAATSLRELLQVLVQDLQDKEICRAILETLVILCVRSNASNEGATRVRQKCKLFSSPLAAARISPQKDVEAIVDNFSLWIADELAQNSDVSKALLQLVQAPDPFTGLYALQLISAMIANRPGPSIQTLLRIPQGISTLVHALSSPQDLVRNEALLVLGALTSDNMECQKLAAFDGAFDCIFEIIEQEGGLCFGGLVTEDSLDLLGNMLRYNVSNQKLFCESSGIPKYLRLLEGMDADKVLNTQATSNVLAALEIARLFVVVGGETTASYQRLLCEAGILVTIMRIAFGPQTSLEIRVAALLTVAALIVDNEFCQEAFLAVDVPYYDLSLALNMEKEPQVTPVSQALLSWVLVLKASHLFDLRAASQHCLCAALRGNEGAKLTFLTQQHQSYKNIAMDTKNNPLENLLYSLAEYDEELRLNPFRIWFATVICMHIIDDTPSMKKEMRSIMIGEETLGVEVLPMIEAIVSQLHTALRTAEPVVSIGYLMVLIVWLWDDSEAVDDFVKDRKLLNSLLTYVSAGRDASNPIVQSLTTALLGVAYDFCSPQASFSRQDFFELLHNTLGRDQYAFQIQRLRENTEYKEFDPNKIFGAPRNTSGLPKVFFDQAFVEFLRERIVRIQKAIDRDPSSVPCSKVSLEMYDELNNRLITTEHLLHASESEKSEITTQLRNLESEFGVCRNVSNRVESELSNLQNELALLRTSCDTLEGENSRLQLSLKTTTSEKVAVSMSLKNLEAEYQSLLTTNETLNKEKMKAEDGINKLTRELLKLKNEVESSARENHRARVDVANHEVKIDQLTGLTQELTKKLEASKDNERVLINERQDLKQQLKSLSESLREHQELLETTKSTQIQIEHTLLEKQNELVKQSEIIKSDQRQLTELRQLLASKEKSVQDAQLAAKINEDKLLEANKLAEDAWKAAKEAKFKLDNTEQQYTALAESSVSTKSCQAPQVQVENLMDHKGEQCSISPSTIKQSANTVMSANINVVKSTGNVFQVTWTEKQAISNLPKPMHCYLQNSNVENAEGYPDWMLSLGGVNLSIEKIEEKVISSLQILDDFKNIYASLEIGVKGLMQLYLNNTNDKGTTFVGIPAQDSQTDVKTDISLSETKNEHFLSIKQAQSNLEKLSTHLIERNELTISDIYEIKDILEMIQRRKLNLTKREDEEKKSRTLSDSFKNGNISESGTSFLGVDEIGQNLRSNLQIAYDTLKFAKLRMSEFMSEFNTIITQNSASFSSRENENLPSLNNTEDSSSKSIYDANWDVAQREASDSNISPPDTNPDNLGIQDLNEAKEPLLREDPGPITGSDNSPSRHFAQESQELTMSKDYDENRNNDNDDDGDDDKNDAILMALAEKDEAISELMVLLDELSMQKAAYKKRLQDLGEHVSDSDGAAESE